MYSGYDYIASGQRAELNGLPFLGPTPVTADRPPFNVDKYLVFLLQTINADGPAEANSTSYFCCITTLPMGGQATDTQQRATTSWPNTHRCSDIVFPR